jgi:PEP-CTERM motif
MKSLKLLLLAAPLFLFSPVPASAGLICTVLDPILGCQDGIAAPVPEPSGALVMGLGLMIAAVARRRRGH